MANYNVTITNGQGSQNMKAGTYNVSATSAPGYDLTSLSPTTFTASKAAGSGSFTLSASGTLTLVFNETGAEGGTPITSGSVVMTNQAGTVEYGSQVTIDSTGNAVFQNVAYGDEQTPFTLYFKQLSSDESHNIESGIISVSMTSIAQTEYVLNSPIAEQTISLMDANYSGLAIPSATLSFEEAA